MSALGLGPRARWARAHGPMLLVAAATAALAAKAIGGVLRKVGHAGPTLDDAYIHFQYARAIAEGHPLRYQAGEPISTGATSVLWPLLLAPFHALGFRDVSLTWIAWAFSFVALGLLAWDAAMLAKPLGGRVAAVTSAALVLAFGGHVWCAASGMEVVPFAWVVARTVRRAAEWAEGARDRRTLVELLACANAAALLRPEGLLFSLAALLVLAAYGKTWRARAWAPAAIALPALAIVILRAASGSALSNTAVAKLLMTSPYLHGAALRDAIAANVRIFFGTLLEGEVWSAEFVPSGGAVVAVLGVGVMLALAIARRRVARGVLLFAFALAMLVPCFYVTFLWNRLRYLWPFATGWLIGLGCLAHVVGVAANKLAPRARIAGPLAGGLFVGLFAAKLPWVLEDVAQSASGIDRQQVAAGRWASQHLPADARIGMNDAGAIAYFSNRKTFDVVGLTTTGEARYWIAGAASRFEHYEKMSAARLPTHFIVYPEWLGCDAILGRALADFTVTDSSILGGQTKRAYVADWSPLGTGELPWSDPHGAIVDSLDVADLESEGDHRYALEDARDGEQIVRTGMIGGVAFTDGARTERTRERFVAHLAPGRAQHVLVRLEPSADTTLHFRVEGAPEHTTEVHAGRWSEVSLPVPPSAARAATAMELATDEPIATYHYWFVVDP